MFRSSCLAQAWRSYRTRRRNPTPLPWSVFHIRSLSGAARLRPRDDVKVADHGDVETIDSTDESSPPLNLLGTVAKRRVTTRLLAEAQRDDGTVEPKPGRKAKVEEAQAADQESDPVKQTRSKMKKPSESDGESIGEETAEVLEKQPQSGEEMEPSKKKRAVKVKQTAEGEITPQFPPKRKRSKSSNKASTELLWDLSESTEGVSNSNQATFRSLPSKSEAEITIDEEMEKALDEWKIPDTDLAKHVFRNTKRFPDCIVLTRVGKFYEAYFEGALKLTSMLDLKLAVRRYKVRAKPSKKKPQSTDSTSKTTSNSLIFPFAGFPVTQMDKYLKLLVHDLGQTVVIVEEDQGGGKDSSGLVRRSVGRVVTPGTLLDESWLSGDESRYLLSIAVGTASSASIGDSPSLPLWLAYTDVSTGEFFSKESTLAKLEDELTRITPREIVLDYSFKQYWSADGQSLYRSDSSGLDEFLSLLKQLNALVSFADTHRAAEYDGEYKEPDEPNNEESSLEAQSLSLLRHYVQYALRDSSPDLSKPETQTDSAFMHIDAATLNGLEIKHAIRFGESTRAGLLTARGTLVSVLNRTISPAGHRLLLRTLSAPSTSVVKIDNRLDLVQAFFEREDLREEVQEMLKPLKDVVRLIQRFKRSSGSEDDIWETGVWIKGIDRICQRIASEMEQEKLLTASAGGSEIDQKGHARLQQFLNGLHDLDDVVREIELIVNEDVLKSPQRSLQAAFAETKESDDPILEEVPDAAVVQDSPELDETEYPAGMSKENKTTLDRHRNTEAAFQQQWWIKPNASQRLAELHELLRRLDDKRADMQEKLQKRFDVAEKDLLLLVRHEHFGHRLHVSRLADREKMSKRQGFRLIGGGKNTKLVDYDGYTVLGDEYERVVQALKDEQNRLYRRLKQKLVEAGDKIQHNAGLVDELDLSMGFAQMASEMGYVRPILTEGTEFKVVNGRHPVVEAALHSFARMFVPNSSNMTAETHLNIITGPNQGGKSTFLRQTAVIAILAQSGSFVPADYAEIGVVDQLFSRIGARDDLFRDRSTFMLEMVETAAILRYATKRSLVIMDEIGRGTTLQAGMAIAYATLDYILYKVGCRTLFATHYHELETMLKEHGADGEERVRKGIEYWCTDVDEADEAVSYSYRLKPGINYNSHAILAARMAGMPTEFMAVAQEKLRLLEHEKVRDDQRRQVAEPSGLVWADASAKEGSA